MGVSIVTPPYGFANIHGGSAAPCAPPLLAAQDLLRLPEPLLGGLPPAQDLCAGLWRQTLQQEDGNKVTFKSRRSPSGRVQSANHDRACGTSWRVT
jgi:hypothetical protein